MRKKTTCASELSLLLQSRPLHCYGHQDNPSSQKRYAVHQADHEDVQAAKQAWPWLAVGQPIRMNTRQHIFNIGHSYSCILMTHVTHLKLDSEKNVADQLPSHPIGIRLRTSQRSSWNRTANRKWLTSCHAQPPYISIRLQRTGT